MFDSRTGRFNHQAPDLKGLGLEWPELAKISAEIDRLGEDFEQTTAKHRELNESRRDAEDKDNAAFAEALRTGKGDPGRKHTDKLEAELAAATRRREALRVALSDLDREKRRVVAENRGKWRAEVERKIPASQSRLRDAVANVRSARSDLQALQALQVWLSEPGRTFKPGASESTSVVMHHKARPVPIEGALDALLTEAGGNDAA